MLLVLLALLVTVVVYKAVQFYHNRQEPFTSAYAALESDASTTVRILPGGHVLFVPRKSSRPTGVMYLPGALVHHHAYAPLCRKVACESGCPVLLVRPTLRIAPFSKSVIAKALVEAQLVEAARIPRWVVGGHSLGGQTAGSIAATGYLSSVSVCGVYLHASYYSMGAALDERMAALQVLARNDGIISQDAADSARAKLPPSAKIAVIEGGNHAGFGHYGPQRFPKPDGERTIELEAQVERAAQLTADWLRTLDDGADAATTRDGTPSRRPSGLAVLADGLSSMVRHDSSPLSPSSARKGQRKAWGDRKDD